MASRRSAVAALFVLLGCATASPPAELVRARAEYARVSQGQASALAPADVHTAKLALDAAEQAYGRDARSATTRDLAYVAERRAQIAEAQAQQVADAVAVAQADASYRVGLAADSQRAKAELARTRAEAAETEREQQARVGAAEARARAEEAARVEAERRADAVAQDLARVAAVREEERGLVITLSGDVLFETDRSSLLPSAQIKLNQLAEALKETDQKLVVEGHTDSRGSDAYNQDLSYRRAAAVRDYLAGCGVPAERLQVAGYGKTRPVADNTSPEGRAQNRRVEIVVEGKSTAKR